jgi:uncharacterized membrane protein YhfC
MDWPVVFHFLNGALMIAMPLGLAIYLTRRWKLGWRLWFIGAATFILSQVGHIPFNSLATNLLNRTPLVNLSPTDALIFNAVFLGLSAGLFEELFRYGMFRWVAKDARSWRKGILAGAGHGGAEAIILGVLVFVSFLQLLYYRTADLAAVLPASQLAEAQSQVAAYWSAPWYMAILGALERFFTIPVQISLAVLVLQTFTRRQWFWVWLAVFYHAIVDCTAVLLSTTGNALLIEGAVGLYALFSVILIFALRQPEPEESGLPVNPPPTAPVVRKPMADTAESLDNSRYA